MRGSWRLLALAAAFVVTAGVGAAGAQTVIVRNAAPGSKVDVTFNSASMGSATASALGIATLAVKRPSEAETDVQFFIDTCGKDHALFLVERGLQPPAAGPACDRKTIPGFFVMRPVTSYVVDLGSSMVWLAQGAAPPEWLGERPVGGGSSVPRVPRGLVAFGGGGVTNFSNFTALACGATDCTGSSSRIGLTAGVAGWFTRFLGVEASYLKPDKLTVDGTGSNFNFNTVLDAHLITLAGLVGVPSGKVRVYAKAGVNYHRATITTNETIQDTSITVDDVPQTIKGGTQTLELQTSGYGYLFGGGVEGWVRTNVAVYVDGGVTKVKGTAVNGGEGAIDERVLYIVVGARIHLGG